MSDIHKPAEVLPAETIIALHEQRYDTSCIPACVELVLKLLHKVQPDYYGQQEAWQNRTDGGFGDYNGKTLYGKTFRHLYFDHARGPNFPLADLFSRIDRELAAGRYVVVSLPSSGNWHMYVIREKLGQEYLSVSKHKKRTITENSVRALVTSVGGTDILVYETAEPRAEPQSAHKPHEENRHDKR